MKLKRLTIAGFRGFNVECCIDFHDKLTVIAAPNSHGKTSISEALEFLIYGATSKVENADAKDEYKGSYRNRHFPPDKLAYIEATFTVAGYAEQNLRVELDADGTSIHRLFNSKSVDAWPFQFALLTAARPFVLQHALKYLLLVPPSERFQGFARLLGLNELDGAFQAIISLCTKPTASLPPEGQRILSELEAIVSRVIAVPELKKIAAHLRNAGKATDAYILIENRADALLGSKVPAKDRLPKLIAARADAAARVYSGNIALHVYSTAESNQLASAQKTLTTAVDAAFLEDYGRLCVHGAVARLQKEASLLDIGVELIAERPDSCPLCTQTLNDDLRCSIHERHTLAKVEIDNNAVREQSRLRVTRTLADLKKELKEHKRLCAIRTEGLIASMQPENAPKVFELLGGSNSASAEIVRASASEANGLLDLLCTEAAKVEGSLKVCDTQVKESKECLADAEVLGEALIAYLAAATNFVRQIAQLEISLIGPIKLFQQAVDALAGTSENTLLIDLLEKRTQVERALRVQELLDSLKDLKKIAEQTLAETMEASMNADLTDAVMKWYGKIRTGGDPDVHFSGFAMERTKGGDFKSRRLAIKAHSYGVELASAVSSLSESKLNALGLCVSIANAIRSPGPWGFLIIDDPIQSWDDEHETQFIDVIRTLVEADNKQVVVLSHKNTWAKQVCLGCRSLNGAHFEITGYTRDGPKFAVIEWSPIDQRLREAEAIANDSTATSVKLQQGEEEIRLAACQLASQVAKDKLGRVTSAHNMNSKDVRTILITAGVESDLVDRISAMFVTADDAHHAPKGYAPNKERIRQAVAAIRNVIINTKRA